MNPATEADWKPRVRAKINELFGIDTRSLALMRVGVSLIVLYDFFYERLLNLTAFQGVGSVFPPEIITNGMWQTPWPILYQWTTAFPAFPLCILLVGLFSASCLLIGWRTRFFSVIVFVCVFAMEVLNPLVLQGGDILIRLILFIGMFLPWGAAFSVDRALQFTEAPRRILSAWTAAFLIQVSFIYFFAGFEKTGAEWTTNGTGVYFALSLDQFTTPIGEFTRQFPAFMSFLTFSVLYLQKSAIYLLFAPFFTFPLRTLAMLALMFMHFSFGIHMNLGPFSWISITALSAFIPTKLWDFVTALLAKKFGGLTLYYDGDCGFCKKSVYLLRIFALLPNTEIRTAQERPEIYAEMEKRDSWVIVDRHGNQTYAYDAGLAIMRASPLFFIFVPFFNLPFAHGVGNRVYRFVANHRSRVCIPSAPSRFNLPLSVRRTLMSVSTVAGITYIAAIATWNYSNLPTARFHPQLPPEYTPIIQKLGIDQRWNMFAPSPLREDGWYAISGTLADGQVINIFDPSKPLPTIDKPANVSALYPNERWRKYLMNIWGRDYYPYRHYFTEYLCKRWNDTHAGGKHLVSINMTFMLETTLENYTTAPIVPMNVYDQQCDAF